jgi:Fic family protein
MPRTRSTTVFLARVNDTLARSPYSFPDDDPSRQRAVEIRQSTAALSRVAPRLREMVTSNPELLGQELGRIHRSQEVYESNAIEGVGLPLKSTHRLLGELFEKKHDPSAYAEWALLQGIREDRHAYDVIGLDAARSMARSLAGDLSRPITEADIRSLHRLVLGDRPESGRYKRYHVRIAGSDHEPTLPLDTPAHVAELMAWFNDRPTTASNTATAVLEAATAHAWFTHIHPFEDGNGRVARLLANLVVCRNGLPPLIVRSKSDRGRYIDALSLSDSGGDITRLVLSFGRYLERTASDYVNPDMAKRVFLADIRERTELSLFNYWEQQFAAWLGAVRRELTLIGYRANLVGGLSSGDFEYLRHRNPRGNGWLMKVQSRTGDDLLVWLGFPTDRLARNLEAEDVFPALYISAANVSGVGGVPYVWVRRDPRSLFTDFVFEPRTKQVYALGPKKPFSLLDADVAAVELSRTIDSFLREPPDLRLEYVRGVPVDPDVITDGAL